MESRSFATLKPAVSLHARRWLIVLVAMAACACLFLGGCSSGIASSESADEGSDESGLSTATDEVEDNDIEAVDDGLGQALTLDEVLDGRPGLYLLRDQNYYELTSDNTSSWEEVSGNEDCLDGLYVADAPFNCYQYKGDPGSPQALFTLEEGDQLITTSSAKYDKRIFKPITSFSYTQNEVPEYSLTYYDEINGIDMSNGEYADGWDGIAAAFETAGVLYNEAYNYVSPSITSVVIGSYEDTKWVETTLSFDIPYVETSGNDEWISASEEKTKDGYFIVDISDVPAGDYILVSGEGGSGYYVKVL